MKRRLLDLLACPIDKAFPLKLVVFEGSPATDIAPDLKVGSIPVCEVYCGHVEKRIEETKIEDTDCVACYRNEVISGVLICPECKRWYPITDKIPTLFPDDMRPKKDYELEFLDAHQDKIPEDMAIGIDEDGARFATWIGDDKK